MKVVENSGALDRIGFRRWAPGCYVVIALLLCLFETWDAAVTRGVDWGWLALSALLFVGGVGASRIRPGGSGLPSE